MADLVAYGAYVPYWRLERSVVSDALGSGGGRGTRAVASYDEDSTSLGVEAARVALRTAGELTPEVVLFATASPAYLDKTNASAVHAALGLPASTGAYDVAGAARSAAGALRMALSSSRSSLVVSSDVRTGLPGGQDEVDTGDAAAALLFADGPPPLVDVLADASASQEFLDRWRTPGAPAARVWEERFGESAYLPSAKAVVTDACKAAGITLDEVDHLVVTGPHGRAARAVRSWAGLPGEKVADDLTSRLGNPGTAQPGLVLTHVLDRAAPGEVVLLVHLADGADAVVLRATPALEAYRQRRGASLEDQLARSSAALTYERFVSWRGQLDREAPRRPDPEAPAAPVSFRREPWKFAFAASRCSTCGTRHLPPARVCFKCRVPGPMEDERLADVAGTVATYTIDRLTYSPSPPMVAAVVDFDGGGRLLCELTDVLPEDVRIGSRVGMTFRRLFTASNGVHNYFWKARLMQEAEER